MQGTIVDRNSQRAWEYYRAHAEWRREQFNFENRHSSLTKQYWKDRVEAIEQTKRSDSILAEWGGVDGVMATIEAGESLIPAAEKHPVMAPLLRRIASKEVTELKQIMAVTDAVGSLQREREYWSAAYISLEDLLEQTRAQLDLTRKRYLEEVEDFPELPAVITRGRREFAVPEEDDGPN